MNILQYFKSLLPSFGRDNIVDDLARMRAELDDNLLPSLEQAAREFKGHALASDYAKGLEVTLRSRFPAYRHLGLFEILLALFKNMPAKVEVLDKIVEVSFAKDVEKEAVTYRHATVMQTVELFSFVIHYTVRLVIRVIAAEACVAAGLANLVDSQLMPAELSYFNDRYVAWLDALKIVAKSQAELEEGLGAPPDIRMDDSSMEGVAATVGAKRLDPLGMNFIDPQWNPIYHFRMHKAELDVASLNSAKEERRLVELRLRDLKNKRGGQKEAHLEHQIEVTEGRLKKLDFKIAKLSGHH